jgi:hypothetical protein
MSQAMGFGIVTKYRVSNIYIIGRDYLNMARYGKDYRGFHKNQINN